MDWLFPIWFWVILVATGSGIGLLLGACSMVDHGPTAGVAGSLLGGLIGGYCGIWLRIRAVSDPSMDYGGAFFGVLAAVLGAVVGTLIGIWITWRWTHG